MKKLLGISLVAILATTPLMASANVGDVIDTDPSNVNGTAAATATTPMFTLAKEAATDGNAASAGYVKGAYNAAIKAVNKVHEEAASAVSAIGNANSGLTKAVADNASDIDELQTAVGDANSGLTKAVADNASDIGALQTAVGDENSGLTKAVADNASDIGTLEGRVDGIDTILTNAVTKTEVTANIDGATGSKTGVSLTVAGTPTGAVTGALANTAVTVSATLPESVDIMNVWGSDTATTLALNNAAPTTLSGNVTSGTIDATFAGSGITGGTATGDITGIDISAPTYIEDQPNS